MLKTKNPPGGSPLRRVLVSVPTLTFCNVAAEIATEQFYAARTDVPRPVYRTACDFGCDFRICAMPNDRGTPRGQPDRKSRPIRGY